MGRHARHRRKARFGPAYAIVILPLVLSTSAQPVAHPAVADRTSADIVYSAQDLLVPAGSTTRYAPVVQLHAAAAKVGRTKPRIKVSGPKGTRVWTASAMSDHDVPAAAARAYRAAARTMSGADGACQIPWTLLAGIGRVESDHGRYGGSTLGTDGVSRPLIIGIALNGAGPVAAIRDTDNGRLDGDKVWDRAVGPMQFIPSTWAGAGRDGDGDGVSSPNDIDDAALAAAAYLCSGSGSVLGDAAMAGAIYRYNQDDYYVALVMALERGYRTGVFSMPPPPAEPAKADRGHHKKHAAKRHHGEPATHRPRGADKPGSTTKPSSGPSHQAPKAKPKPAPKPAPKPTPSPKPKPKPKGPQLTTVSGSFESCGPPSGWCLDGQPLDLGPVDMSRKAAADFDGNGETEENREEFEGLSDGDGSVTLVVEEKASGWVVYVINEMDYRGLDGSLAGPAATSDD